MVRSICLAMSVRRAPAQAPVATKQLTRLEHVMRIGQACQLGGKPCRYVIVTMGPTGAGKSTLIKETARALGLASTPSEILVDDLVENNTEYKRRVLEILLDLYQGKTKEEFKQIMMNPTPAMYEAFTKAYFEVRDSAPCDSLISLGNCNYANDMKIKVELAKGNNVVIESKGTYDPSWVRGFVKANAPAEYDYVMVYSHVVVNFDELLERNTTRAFNAAMAFLKSPETAPAPRLPNVGDSEGNCNKLKYRKEVAQIKKVLGGLLASGSPGKDRMLIFDNNNTMRLIYDSHTMKDVDPSRVWRMIDTTRMSVPPVPEQCK